MLRAQITRYGGCWSKKGASSRIGMLCLLAVASCYQANAGTRTVVDETGRSVTLPENIRRIVSLAPNLTEIVYALGAEQRLVGVTDYCDFPADARTKTSVGAPLNPSLEAIAALQPDVVLATESINRLETVDSLNHLGIPVYTTDPRTVAGVLDSVEHIADAIGSPEPGRVLHAQLAERLAALHTRLAGIPAKKVLFVIWLQPLISVGPHTFLADAVRQAGGESVVQSEQDWPELSLEEVVRLQPEALIFSANHTGSGTASSSGKASQTSQDELNELRGLPVWKDLQAVRAGHVIVTGEEIDRPSPRLLDAIESVARQLHPEAFAEPETGGAASGWGHIPHFACVPGVNQGEGAPCNPR
jgi:iron complex transport system substrate-binding protein